MKIKEREKRTKLDRIILGRDRNRVKDIHEMNGGKKGDRAGDTTKQTNIIRIMNVPVPVSLYGDIVKLIPTHSRSILSNACSI